MAVSRVTLSVFLAALLGSVGSSARTFAFSPIARHSVQRGESTSLGHTRVVADLASPSQVLPIRAAFYYPWFPETWTHEDIYPYTNHHPTLGLYDSSSPALISEHISAMQYGGIQAGIASWWGRGSLTDQRISLLLARAAGTGFKWSLYYEPEALGDPSPREIASDLSYIQDRYGDDPSYLHIGGSFVLFVYADPDDDCGMAARWQQGKRLEGFIVLKVFPGYLECSSQPDSWHQYSPDTAEDSQVPYSFSISPGFWKVEESPRLIRNLGRWNQNVWHMITSDATFHLITTFNEWGEGTGIESAREWSSPSGYGRFLDVLHNDGARALRTPTR